MPVVDPEVYSNQVPGRPHKPPQPATPKPRPWVPPGSGARAPVQNDPWAAYRVGTNSAYDQATAIIEAFLSLIGNPTSVNAIDLVHKLLGTGLEYSQEQAYNWLFTQMSSDIQKAHPNAEFGLPFDTYVQQLNAFKDQWLFFTGGSDIPSDVLRMAIDQGWTQQEMLDFLQQDKRYSNPATMPWLQQGMGYRDVKNQFFQIYGKNPTNSDQLASWWSFRQGAQQIQGGTAAPVTAGRGPAPNLPSQSETR